MKITIKSLIISATLGSLLFTGCGDTKVEDKKEYPLFGQHTTEILLDNGFTKKEIEDLLEKKIVN